MANMFECGVGVPKLQSKTVAPHTYAQTVKPDNNYDGISQVEVKAVALQAKTVAPSASVQTVKPDSGYLGLSQVTVNAATLQSKTVSPSTSAQTIKPDSGYYGLSQVVVKSASGVGKVGKKLVGTLNGNGVTNFSGTINVTGVLANYKNLTANDFIMELAKVNYSASESSYSGEATSTLSYDASNGIITCAGIGTRNSSHWAGGGAVVNVYYLYVE